MDVICQRLRIYEKNEAYIQRNVRTQLANGSLLHKAEWPINQRIHNLQTLKKKLLELHEQWQVAKLCLLLTWCCRKHFV